MLLEIAYCLCEKIVTNRFLSVTILITFIALFIMKSRGLYWRALVTGMGLLSAHNSKLADQRFIINWPSKRSLN